MTRQRRRQPKVILTPFGEQLMEQQRAMQVECERLGIDWSAVILRSATSPLGLRQAFEEAVAVKQVVH